MMRLEVAEYVTRVFDGTEIEPPVIDIAAGWTTNVKQIAEARGLKYLSHDAINHDDNIDIVCDIYALPLPDSYAGTVVCTETLEHLYEPFQALLGMSRILKPGGLIIITTHTAWEIHRYPVDTFRYMPDGLTYLLQKAGFKDVSIELNGNPGNFGGIFATAVKA